MEALFNVDRLAVLMWVSLEVRVEVMKLATDIPPTNEDGTCKYCRKINHDKRCAWVVARQATYEWVATVEHYAHKAQQPADDSGRG